MDEIHLLRDLAVVFGCAAPVLYVFHRLKQSPIVGFVVTGTLVGPYGLSLVADVDSVHTLATVGVMIAPKLHPTITSGRSGICGWCCMTNASAVSFASAY